MMMMGAFLAAVAQLPDRSFRRVFWRGLAVAVGLLLALAIVSSLGLGWLAPANLTGVDVLLSTLGALAGLFLGWLLFPALTASVIALMVEPIARAVEAKHYADAPPPRPQSTREIMASGLRLAAASILINLIALPAYLLLPALNLAIFLIFNGYIVARGNFEAAAARRFEPARQRALWRQLRTRLWLAGAGLAFLLTIPFVNLVTPMVGLSFMAHIVERMRHRQTPK